MLDGELYEVSKNPPHNVAVTLLALLLNKLVHGAFHIRQEQPVAPWDRWSPEPDVAVVRGRPTDYWERNPGPADVPLIIEVCDTTTQDRTEKVPGYAQAGIPVYWILDLNRACLEVFRSPIAGQYVEHTVLLETESVDIMVDDQSFGRIAVADLLPPRPQ